jgi:chemotaxis protein MotA
MNFFSALTSTFWGLVFAIVFKLLDGFLSSRMDDNDKSVTMLLERRQRELEGKT